MLKKSLSTITAIILLFSCTCITSYAADLNYFIYSYNNAYINSGAFLATLDSSGDFSQLSDGELVVPETYTDSSHGELPIIISSLSPTSDNTYIKSVKTNSSYGSISQRAFKNLSELVKVTYTNANTLIFRDATFNNCSSKLKDVYIYASSVDMSATYAKEAFRTFIDNVGAKIHVTNDNVKQQIIDGTARGNYKVTNDMIDVDLQDNRPTSSIEINCDNINYGTKGGFKPSVTVKVGETEKPELKEKVTLALYNNSECTGKDLGYTSENLAVNHYWLKATLEGTDEYQGSTAVKEVQVVDPNAAFKEGLKTLIDQGDAAVAKHQETEGGLYYSVKELQTALENAKTVYNNPAAEITDITTAITQLDAAIKGLVLKSDLASEEERLAFNTDVYSKYINYKEADYTAESWKESGFGELQKKLSELNVLSGAVTSKQLQELKSQLEEAFGKLVKRTDFETEYAALEEAMTNAKAILDDNPTAKYADSQIETLQAAYDAAEKVLEDKESVTNRAVIINATADVNNAINSLEEVDKTELLSKLQSVIEEAEAMDSEKETYTAESYKVLTDAIEAAKGITEDSTVTEMQTATENIRSAISGLEKDLDSIQAAKDELSKAVEEAEAIDSSKYTEESYAKVADTINEAKRLIARQNVNLTVSGLKAAQAALEEAINGLKEKQPEGPSDQPSDNNNNNNNGSNNIKKPPVNNNVVVKTTSREDAVKAAKAKAKSQMKQAKIKKLKVKSKAKKTIKVTWKKVKKAKGYRVQVSTNKKFKKSKIIFEKHTKKKTLKITKKIKSGKTYYVRVSAYTTYKDINGKTQKVYSKNKPLQKVKVK